MKDKYLLIRFGKPHQKKVWGFPYGDLIELAGTKLGFSKTEIKRMDKQNGIHIWIGEI